MRTIGPSPEGDKKVVVVIPSFNEGEKTLRSVASVARQEGVEIQDLAVLVIVNNARDAAREVMESNEETLSLGEQVMRDEVTDKTDSSSLQLFGMDYSVPESCRAIISANLNLVMVDLSTEDNALPECNVGIARQIGGELACEYVREDGVIVMIDADTFLRKDALRSLIDYFDSSPNVAAATGPRTFRPEVFGGYEHDLFMAHNLKGTVNQLISRFIKVRNDGVFPWLVQSMIDEDRLDWMRGSNMAFRPGPFKSVGGFPLTDGAEDLGFSLRLLNDGYEIDKVGGFKICTLARQSDRTNENHGYGQLLIKTANEGPLVGNHQIPSLESCQLKFELQMWLEVFTRYAESDEELKKLVGSLKLTKDEIETICRAKEKAPNLNAGQNPFFVLAIKEVCEKRFAPKPLREVLEEMRHVLVEGSNTARELYSSMGEFIEFQEAMTDAIASAIEDAMGRLSQLSSTALGEMTLPELIRRMRRDMKIPNDLADYENLKIALEVKRLHNMIDLYAIPGRVYLLIELCENILGDAAPEIAELLKGRLDALKKLTKQGFTDDLEHFLKLKFADTVASNFDNFFEKWRPIINQRVIDVTFSMNKAYVELALEAEFIGESIREFKNTLGDFVADLVERGALKDKENLIRKHANEVMRNIDIVVEDLSYSVPVLDAVNKIKEFLSVVRGGAITF